MGNYTTFKKDLEAKLTDGEFKKRYERELRKLRLGHQIASVRKRLGLTQKELAKRLRTSQGAITRIENGEYTGYSLHTLEKIALATGARLDIHLHL